MPDSKTVAIEVLSLEEDSHHIFVNGSVNGVECRFLIDTGASKSVLGQTFVQSHLAEIKTEQSEEMTSGLGTNEMQSASTTIDAIVIGDWKVEEYTVAILDLKHVEIAYQKKDQVPPDAIIGSDILLKGNAIINYGDATLTLH